MNKRNDEKELAQHIIEKMIKNDAFSRWLGIEILEIGPGQAKIRMTIRDEMLNGFGVSHGGVVFSFADSAFAFASNTRRRIALAVDNHISYPNKINSGDTLIATAKEIHLNHRFGIYEVIVTNQNEQKVAIFKGTAYRTSKEHFPDQSNNLTNE